MLLQTGEGAQALLDRLGDPALLELVFIALLSGLLIWVLIALRTAMRRLHGRRQLAAYLEGVEAVLAGDPATGRKLLAPVVAEDPENLGARLALGEAHAALGEPADAHREHLEAKQVFAAEGQKLQLAIVRDLRAAGELGEACLQVDEALRGAPKDLALQREAWELKLEAGLFEDALPHGRVLFDDAPDAGLRRRLAHAAARAGTLRLQRGEPEHARRLFGSALGYDAENHEARKGRIALGDEVAPIHELLEHRPESHALVPVDAAGQPLAPLPEERSPVPVRALELFPECVCSRCGAPVPASLQREARFSCEVCGSEAEPIYGDAEMQGRVQDATQVLDEIEENERYVKRLAQDCASGSEIAGRQLLELGERALLACLDVCHAGDSSEYLDRAVIQLARRAPATLMIWRKQTLQAPALLGRRPREAADQLLAPLLRQLGPDALPWLRSVLQRVPELGDLSLRGLVVHGYVGTRDLIAFEDLSARMSPVEIVRHLNHVPSEELADWIAELPAGPSYVREAILLDEQLDRDRAFGLALARVDEARVGELASVLRERGPEDELVRTLVEMLEGERRGAERAEAVLQSFGVDALAELVAAFADPRLTGSRVRVTRLIHACGARAVPLLARCFGGAPAESDDRTIALIAEIGNPAVPPLAESYRQRPRWFGFVPARRSSSRHPRACKLRALARIATPLAKETLQELAREEHDEELQSLAKQLLRARSERR